MANFVGMDVQAVEQLSKDLATEAGKISEVIAKIDNLVGHMQNIWKGHDADQFAGWWRDQHRKALHNAQEDIAGLGRSAHNNAREQDDVSRR
jgi:uncharacterized protein YukE